MNLNESTPSSEIEGYACVCCDCGMDVFPLPFRVNLGIHMVRAIVRGVWIVDSRTGTLRQRAILFCPDCADPEEVEDYEQLESFPPHNAAAHAARVASAKDDARRAVYP